jgi:hypothetical protein
MTSVVAPENVSESSEIRTTPELSRLGRVVATEAAIQPALSCGAVRKQPIIPREFRAGFEGNMRLLAVVLAAAFSVAALSAADAQQTRPRRAVVDAGPGSTTIITRDEQGRVRTKILVQKRSYLDGGTEVMPGDMSGTNRDALINSFYYSPSSDSVSNHNIVPGRPITDPFFLPGKNNPFFN